MSRKTIIAGNWKLNMNKKETQAFLEVFASDANFKNSNSNVEIMIFPPFTSLDTAKASLDKNKLSVILGAQDLSQFESGAYTGEISSSMLQEIGVEYVLVGHSERREVFNEDDAVILAKLQAALNSGLQVILCCGESEATRESGKTDAWISKQIESALNPVIKNAELYKNLVIAYEPIWAIGTGKTCDSAEANRVIAFIRSELKRLGGEEFAQKTRILYGGSVKASNIEEILKQSDIDGALIGGASIKKEEILEIVKKSSLVGSC